MNKYRSRKRTALLAIILLLIGLPCVVGIVWVRQEQRQYALDRHLIAALKQDDTKRAIVLVEAGADPNTREIQTPALSLVELLQQLLRRSTLSVNPSSTAFMMAFGIQWDEGTHAYSGINELDPQLTQVMLRHRPDVNLEDSEGRTVLYLAVRVNHPDITLIKQLLDHGADPNIKAVVGTPFDFAEALHRPDIVALLRKYSKHL